MTPVLIPSIVCPRCHQELDAQREACPHCGAFLMEAPTTATVIPPAPGRPWDRPWVVVVLLLHLGFLGIPLYWKTPYSTGTRLGICVASVVYTVFAVAVIWLVGSYVYRELMAA